MSSSGEDRYQVEQATPEDTYKLDLIELARELRFRIINLRLGYLSGRGNLDMHYEAVCLACAIYEELAPKIQGTMLEAGFKRWVKVVDEPSCFFIPGYEKLIFALNIQLGWAMEYLNIKKLT